MEEGHDNHPMANIKIEDEEISEQNAKERSPERARSESRRGRRAQKRKKFEWQDEPTLQLIEFIKLHPSIWDNTDVMYRNVRMNKNLFLELVSVLSNKYPDHGYTYEIVRRKWDSLKGYYSRKAVRNPNNTTMEKELKTNGNTNNEDEASDAVHWAYFERLSFLGTSLSKINASEAGSDEENELDLVQSEPLNLEFSNGSTTVKTHLVPKRRKHHSMENPTENGDHSAGPISLVTEKSDNLRNLTSTPNQPTSQQTPQQTPMSPTATGSDPDCFGIGKYVGRVIQDLDADLTDELVSRVVRDCIEVRHKQRLRFAEMYQNN
uniref:CSON004329 protein n=1 Tax=Culicoides sonorensis TaxID=179676 RepID=A0A336MNW3_CULSO